MHIRYVSAKIPKLTKAGDYILHIHLYFSYEMPEGKLLEIGY